MMNSRLLIALVGMPGSGKGTVVDYLASNYGWPTVHFGNMVYEEIERRGLDRVKDEKFVRVDMREKEGPEVLAKRVAKRADELFVSGNKVVVADGLYSWSEYKHLAKEFGDALVVIAVVLPKKLRYKRVTSRVEAKRKYTLEDAKARDIQEIEDVEKGGPIAFADYYVLNNVKLDDLHEQIDKIIEELKLHDQSY